MRTELSGYDSPGDIFHVYRIYFFIIAVSYFVLVFDWVSNLHNEYTMVIRPKITGESRRYLSFKPVFLASRYLTLGWCTFVVATWASVSFNNSVCSWFQYYPYGYSIVALPAHMLMILRIHSIYGRPNKLLLILMGLALADFIVQMAVNHLATSVLLANTNPNFAICFTYPTTAVFCLVFLSPTIFHHILLVLTLWKSVRQLQSSKSVGITPILHVIQRDHILYTLSICLVNFTNFVLVLQPGAWPYKLIMQLPALVFTQIFLSRMVFSLKRTQVSTLAGTNLSKSNITNSNPESGPSQSSSGQQEKSGGSGTTLVAQSRKNSASEKAGLPTKTTPVKKAVDSQTRSQSQLRRASADDVGAAPTSQSSHRRGSSATLAPSPRSSGDIKFTNYSMNPHSSEEIPPVPTSAPGQAPAVPPFSSLPVRYQNYRLPHRTMPGGRFKRQNDSRDGSISVDVARATEVDDSHPSEAGDQVLEISSAYSQPPTVYPYLFEPPGTATSSLPPATANSDIANRSSGEFEIYDGKAIRTAHIPTSAIPVSGAATAAPADVTSARQSYHTSRSSLPNSPSS